MCCINLPSVTFCCSLLKTAFFKWLFIKCGSNWRKYKFLLCFLPVFFCFWGFFWQIYTTSLNQLFWRLLHHHDIVLLLQVVLHHHHESNIIISTVVFIAIHSNFVEYRLWVIVIFACLWVLNFFNFCFKARIHCETFLSEHFMKYSFRDISWNMKYFHEIFLP